MLIAEHLKHLCVTWQRQVQVIPLSDEEHSLQSWGPSEEELLHALTSESQGSWDTMEIDENEVESEDDNHEDAELAEEIEASALADAYKADY